MRCRPTEDVPSYAAETVASAQLSGSYLAASGGLFFAILAAMSAMEVPILPPKASSGETPIRATHGEPAWTGAAGTPTACAGPQIPTLHPAGEAAAQAG